MAKSTSIAEDLDAKDNPRSDFVPVDLTPLLNSNEALRKAFQDSHQNLANVIKELVKIVPAAEVHYGPTPPPNPQEGDLWLNTSETPPRMYSYVV